MIRIEYFLTDIKIRHMSIRYYYYKSGASSIIAFYTTFWGLEVFSLQPVSDDPCRTNFRISDSASPTTALPLAQSTI